MAGMSVAAPIGMTVVGLTGGDPGSSRTAVGPTGGAGPPIDLPDGPPDPPPRDESRDLHYGDDRLTYDDDAIIY